MQVFLVSILGVQGVLFGFDPRKNKDVKIHVSQPGAWIPATFIYSLIQLKNSQLSKSVGLSFTPLSLPPQSCPHLLRELFCHFLRNYGCFPSLKIKPLHTLYYLKSKFLKNSHNFFAHFTSVFFPLWYFDLQIPSSLSEGLLCSAVSLSLTSHLKFHLKSLPFPCIPYSFLPWLPFI